MIGDPTFSAFFESLLLGTLRQTYFHICISYFHISLWVVFAWSSVIPGFCLHGKEKTGRFDFRENSEETLQGAELLKEEYSWIF